MSIVLNTELCWPLAAVGPNNTVVGRSSELFEHAGRGVGDNVSNPAKLPAILLPAHVHTAANQGVIELGRLFVRATVDLGHVHAVALLERDSASSHALAEHRVNHCRTHLEHLPVSIGQRLAAMVLYGLPCARGTAPLGT